MISCYFVPVTIHFNAQISLWGPLGAPPRWCLCPVTCSHFSLSKTWFWNSKIFQALFVLSWPWPWNHVFKKPSFALVESDNLETKISAIEVHHQGGVIASRPPEQMELGNTHYTCARAHTHTHTRENSDFAPLPPLWSQTTGLILVLFSLIFLWNVFIEIQFTYSMLISAV